MKKLSIIVPVYYNAENLLPLYNDLREKVFAKLTWDYELVLVDDGSKDASYSVMQELAKLDSKIVLVKLSRNFGEHAAILAGLSKCSGNCAVRKAADLQEPSEMILDMLEKYEAGIVLHGTEVKSLRMGNCSIKEAFIRIEDGEMFIYGMHISPYEKGNIFNKDPLRVRKLLLHKKEIDKIFGKMKEKGNTVVPLQVYFSGSLVKVEIGLAKGKKLYDKRDDIAKKDQRREAQRDFKVRNLG